MYQQSELSHSATALRPLPLKEWPPMSHEMKAFEVGPSIWPKENLQGHTYYFDHVSEIPSDESYDRGLITTALNDLPLKLFEVMKPEGYLLFIIKSGLGEILFITKKHEDHFEVIKKYRGHYAAYADNEMEHFTNDLSDLNLSEGRISIWPQGTMNLGGHLVIGRDMIFQVQ